MNEEFGYGNVKTVDFENDMKNKKYFYIGEDKNTNDVNGYDELKIGITNNPKGRLYYYDKEFQNFTFLFLIKTDKALDLEDILKEIHYKSGFASWGSEWFSCRKKDEDFERLKNECIELLDCNDIKYEIISEDDLKLINNRNTNYKIIKMDEKDYELWYKNKFNK
jgi:hypothetical protein